MVRAHLAETIKAAVTFVEQGHVRVGPDTIRDPAFLVTRYILQRLLTPSADSVNRLFLLLDPWKTT